MATGIGGGSVQLALLLQVYVLTGSATAVGALGLAQFVALAVGTVSGAAVTDRYERRRVLLTTRWLLGVGVALMMLTSMQAQPQVAFLVGASVFGSIVASLHFPTRTAMIPRMVSPEYLTRAMSMEHAVWSASLIVGPIIGGLVADGWGFTAAYGLGVLGHLIAGIAERGTTPQPAFGPSRSDAVGLAAIRTGLQYIRNHSVLASLLVLDLVILGFGTRQSIYPLVVENGEASGDLVGLLLAATPAGALIMSALGGWLGRIHRQGAVVIAASVGWGVAVVGFGMSGQSPVWQFAFLAAAGGTHIIVATLRAVIIADSVPAFMQGRVWGAVFLAANAGMRLGNFEAGAVADGAGAAVSIITGGLACVVGVAIIAMRTPELRRYRSSAAAEPAQE